MSLPRHAEYKPSGAEWLGDIPQHWRVDVLKHHLERNDGGVWGDDPSGLRDTVVLRSTEQTVDGRWQVDEPALRHLSDGEAASALLVEGDLLVTKSSGSALHIGKTTLVTREIADLHCCFSNFMQRLRTCPSLRPRMAWYLLNSDLVRRQFDLHANSTTGLANLNGGLISNILVSVPPLDEQADILAFLDEETSKIDALVAEQRRLIDLLKEKRQAVISHAVTKGLNPDAPMKLSGIENLGDVPAHWRLSKAKHLLQSIEQGWSPQCEGLPAATDEEWGVLKVGCVNDGVFNPFENKALPADLQAIPSLAIARGDLLISRANTRQLVGSVAVVDRDYPRLMLCDKLYRVRVTADEADAQFVSYLLSSSYARGQIELSATGASASMVNISQSAVLDLDVAVPMLQEQTVIVAATLSRLAQIGGLTSQAERAIDLLHERRTALISAAVTGQIDVRGLVPLEAA